MQKRGSYSQTLDELLGLTNKPAPSQSQASTRTTSTYPERPATRHGRSSGSNTASSSGKGSSPEHIQNPSPDAISKSSSRIDVWSRDENEPEAAAEPPVVDKPPKSTAESPVAKNRSMSTEAFRKKPSVILERRESLSSVSSRSTATSSSTPASSNKSGGGTHRIDTGDAVASAAVLPQAESKQVLPSEVNGRRMSLQQKTAVDKAVASKPTPARAPLPAVRHARPQRSTSAAPATAKKTKSSRPESTTVASLAGRKLDESLSSSSFNAWLQQKMVEDRERRKKIRDQQEEEKQKIQEKKKDAEKSFQRWKEDRDREIRRELQKKKEDEERKKREAEDKESRRKEAEKMFEMWKKSQEEKLKETRQRSANRDRKRSQSVNHEREQKKREAEKAFDAWKKDIAEREQREKERQIQKMENEEKRKEKEEEYKRALANEAYDIWLEMKKSQRGYSESLSYKILEYETEAKRRWPTPWVPSGPTVPRKFNGGGGNRRRTLERPVRLPPRRTKSVT